MVPNWNSMTIPVATPRAKFTAKMRDQNRAMLWYTAVAGAQVHPLHDHHDRAEPDRQRREQVMEHDRQGELNARQQEYVVHLFSHPGRPELNGWEFGWPNVEHVQPGRRHDIDHAHMWIAGIGKRYWSRSLVFNCFDRL